MIIKKLSIENYKSFYRKQDIFLDLGFNLFIGKNNSGKTSALELINNFSTVNDPHKSQLSIQTYGDTPTDHSYYSIALETTTKELCKITNQHLIIPLPTTHRINTTELETGEIIEHGKLTLEYFCHTDYQLEVESNYGRSTRQTPHDTGQGIMMSYKGDALTCNTSSFGNVASNLIKIFPLLKKSFYRFSAVRHPQTKYGMDLTTDLSPNASNLAFCINHLQTNDADAHALLCKLINRIFPEISWIQSTPDLKEQFELRCLPFLPKEQRNDLAIPLDKMGTGIGNILAILYVVLTARFPKVIAIDEPNLFLHPKAFRELLQILGSEGKQHQYILTGHSPDILTAIEPSTITYFDVKNSETITKSIKNNEYHTIRSELSDLGIRMTDLHARDRVLWVEGQTEEIVFPKLLNAFFPELAAGTAVLRVTHTGTFEKKTGIPANEVADAYKRLTAQGLVPPLVTILLDKESRTDTDINNLLKKSKSLKILPVKMIENYVIDIDAIHYVLTKNGSSNRKDEIVLEDFNQATSDGAKILKTIFSNSTPTTIEYRKTTHTVELFDWIIDNKPEILDDLKKIY